MSHQIKQVSPGRAIKVRDDSAKGQEISEGNCVNSNDFSDFLPNDWNDSNQKDKGTLLLGVK